VQGFSFAFLVEAHLVAVELRRRPELVSSEYVLVQRVLRVLVALPVTFEVFFREIRSSACHFPGATRDRATQS
jgi:hypothetical protein